MLGRGVRTNSLEDHGVKDQSIAAPMAGCEPTHSLGGTSPAPGRNCFLSPQCSSSLISRSI